MSKKIRSFLAIALIFSIIASVNILGAQSNPSTWAEIEVSEAIVNDLVHESLRSNYQTPIKRYEYVLLALEVLEKSGIDATIQQEYVFDDILGHPYEKEVLKAYYSGIISGYGNGLFKPDDNISRQEVATLVVKLIKRIDSEKITSLNGNLNYSDSSLISSWARESVDYCYANSIIKGVGKDNNGLDIIKPSGTATREESILLLYRLANVEKVISETPTFLTIDQIETEETTEEEPEAFDFTYLARKFNAKTVKEIIRLDGVEDVDIIDATNESITFAIGENTTIYIAKVNSGIFLDLASVGIVSNRAKEIYMGLLITLNDSEAVVDSIDEGIINLNLSKTSTEVEVDKKYSISIRIDDNMDDDVYLVKYFDKES